MMNAENGIFAFVTPGGESMDDYATAPMTLTGGSGDEEAENERVHARQRGHRGSNHDNSMHNDDDVDHNMENDDLKNGDNDDDDTGEIVQATMQQTTAEIDAIFGTMQDSMAHLLAQLEAFVCTAAKSHAVLEQVMAATEAETARLEELAPALDTALQFELPSPSSYGA